MVASLAILVISAFLFVYWFRYTCIWILRGKAVRGFAAGIAEANQLSFPSIQEKLSGEAQMSSLNALRSALDRDYKIVSYLLRHGAEFQVGGDNLEHIMLMVDYRIMTGIFWLSRMLGARQAVNALREMVQIVDYFANAMGERVAVTARS
jgi:hypothetical protein